MTGYHIDYADQDPRIPPIKEAKGCERPFCPDVEGFEMGYGLAGGGMGPYLYCEACGLIRGKDQDPQDSLDEDPL